MIPERVEIIVQAASLDRSAGGAITGPLWLEHGARDAPRRAFPEPDWTDFPVVVLSWWLDALTAVRRADMEEAICAFMDGPFEIAVRDAGQTLARVRCLERELDAVELRADFTTPLPALSAAVRAAGAATLAECGRRGWTGRDVDELRRALAGSEIWEQQSNVG